MNEEKNAVAEYYLTSPHKKAKGFRKDVNYKGILKLASQGQIQANDVYQKTDVAEGKKERGRVIETMLKNLVKWGFLVKTGKKDSLYRQEIFSLNQSLRKQVRLLVKKGNRNKKLNKVKLGETKQRILLFVAHNVRILTGSESQGYL